MSDLAKRLRIKAGMIEMGERIAWGSDSALMREAADALGHAAVERKKVSRPQIREAFLRNGARIEPDRDDLPDYVYEAAFELLEMAAPAVQGEPSLVAWVLYDATADQKYIKMHSGGLLAIFDSEAAARRAKLLHPGTDYKRCEYYDAQQPAAHQPCPEGVREGAPYDDPAFESLCREYGIWGTAAAAQCAVFWGAGKRVADQQSVLLDDDSPAYQVGEIGNQIHNLGCEHQNDEELADRLAEIAHQAWMLQRSVTISKQRPAPDVAGLVDALDAIANLPIDPCSTKNDYRLSAAKAIANAELAAHRKQGGEK